MDLSPHYVKRLCDEHKLGYVVKEYEDTVDLGSSSATSRRARSSATCLDRQRSALRPPTLKKPPRLLLSDSLAR
jgi:hypothetical protein